MSGARWDRWSGARRRRAAAMHRRLEQLDELDRRAGGYAGAGGFPRPGLASVQRPRRFILFSVVLLTIVLTVSALWARTQLGTSVDHVVAILDSQTVPGRPSDAGMTRVLPAPTAPVGSAGFTFMAENLRGPAAYDPCRPVHYVVNTTNVPAGANGIVEEAVVAVSAASGIAFVADGLTDEKPMPERAARQPDRYGAGWAPVLIAWTTPEADGRLEGSVAGVGGSMVMEDDRGQLVNVTGAVHLDSPAIGEILQAPNGRAEAIAIVMHELMHVAGLGHTDVPGQLMNETNSGQTALGDGDRRGLAALAERACTTSF